MSLGELPHLLFYGPAGTGRNQQENLRLFEFRFQGKTSTILALAKQMYTPTEMRGCVLEVTKSVPLKSFDRKCRIVFLFVGLVKCVG